MIMSFVLDFIIHIKTHLPDNNLDHWYRIYRTTLRTNKTYMDLTLQNQYNDNDHKSDPGLTGQKKELAFALACGVLLAIGFALAFIDGIAKSTSLFFYAGP